jgi:HEAT repeat protein
MQKPLIFDPSTGELISSSRGAAPAPKSADDGRAAAAEKAELPLLEDRVVGVLCKGDQNQRLDALLVVSSDLRREWSARVVAAVVYQLAQPGATLRREALRIARELGFHAAVIPVVSAILNEADTSAKLAVLELAASYGVQGTALADCMLPFIESSSAPIAEAAALAVGSVGLTPSSVKELASLIRHKEGRVRIQAVRLLEYLGARAAMVSGLVVLRLDDPDESVRRAASDALVQIGFHASAMDEIKRMLNHGNKARRVEMLGILARFGSSAQESSELVVPLIKCDEREVAEAARKTLRVVGLNKDCFKPIEHLAGHPSLAVRGAALELLEECGAAPEACLLALSMMTDRDLGLRERAAAVVSSIGIPAMCLPGLRKVLRDERDDVRLLALSALERAGELARPASKLVIERMEDASSDVASTAAAAFVVTAKIADCVPEVARILRNRRQDRKLLMLGALRQMGHKAGEALPQVTASMGDADWVVRDAACETFIAIGFHDSCIPEVRHLIDHQDRNYRLAVIKALGACGMSAAAAGKFLAQRQSDSDAEVGRAARSALAAVTGKPS